MYTLPNIFELLFDYYLISSQDNIYIYYERKDFSMNSSRFFLSVNDIFIGKSSVNIRVVSSYE